MSRRFYRLFRRASGSEGNPAQTATSAMTEKLRFTEQPDAQSPKDVLVSFGRDFPGFAA